MERDGHPDSEIKVRKKNKNVVFRDPFPNLRKVNHLYTRGVRVEEYCFTPDGTRAIINLLDKIKTQLTVATLSTEGQVLCVPGFSMCISGFLPVILPMLPKCLK